MDDIVLLVEEVEDFRQLTDSRGNIQKILDIYLSIKARRIKTINFLRENEFEYNAA